MTALSPAPGRIALVRQRRYLVENVTPSPSPDEAMLVDMSCLDDDAQGEPLSVLWEHEIDARILEDGGWSTVTDKGFDEPALFAAYLRTLSWNCVTATDPNLFQVPFRSGIRVDAYQLDRLRKALRLPRFRTIFQSVATNLSRHGRCTRRRVELPWGKYVLYNGHNLFYVNNL